MTPPKEKPKRTYTQNKAIHAYFTLVAQELNDAGYTVQLVLKEKMDLDFTPDMVKELLWRPAQQAILGIKSTTELNKLEDIDKIYDHLNRHLSEKFELHIPFPSKEHVSEIFQHSRELEESNYPSAEDEGIDVEKCSF